MKISSPKLFLPLALCAALVPGLGPSAGLSAQAVGTTGASGGSGSRFLLETARASGIDADAEVEVDGYLEEAVWSQAPVASGFVQGEPVEGVPAEEDTKVWVLIDGSSLFIGARMEDSDPESIADQLVRRDSWGNYDYLQVSLDPNLDRRTGYRFTVSAANVQSDAYLYDDSRDDKAWDAVWDSGVKRDSGGWTVEMRIPLSQIRYEASDSTQTWGVNFTRLRQKTKEKSYFRLMSRLQQGTVSQFGRLEGLLIPQAPRRIEVRPYVLSSAHRGPSELGDPFFDGSAFDARTGLELRYGLGTAFTLDATINPDFGQVEADPATINLSAFETFYEERRPFFVEDARVLDFKLSGHRNSLFYSRRIGRSPQGYAPSGADFSDVPEAATILGAAKVTGRTSKGLSIGAMAAVTQEEKGKAFFDGPGSAGGGLTESFAVEPRSEFGVFRLQQDIRDGATNFGGIATAMRRELPSDGAFDFLTSSSYTAGLDFEHTWNDREWALTGFFAASHVQGDSLAMIRLQRSSNHYYQRPDALWTEMDSAATSMSGAEWRLQLDRRSGEHWTGGIWAGQVTSGFEINDLGFSQSREKLDAGARVSYREIQPGRVFRNYNISVFTFHNWSHDVLEDDPWALDAWGRAHTRGAVWMSGKGEFLNFWEIDGNLRYSPETMSRTATRGGPMMLDPGSVSLGLRINTDRRKAVNLTPGFEVSNGRNDSGRSFRTGFQLEVRPSPRMEVSVQPAYHRQVEGAQYVTSTGVLPFEPTYGPRYLFSDLERTTVSMETRLNMTFSPTLSLQVFAQPFFSSGDYQSYKQLSRSESFEFDVLSEGQHFAGDDGVDVCLSGRSCLDESGRRHLDLDGDGAVDYSLTDRDFNLRSLIGNAVVRWEYRPGSTIFLVWQRRQADWAQVGDFELSRDLDGLLAAESDNVFMVKVNYWLGL